VQPSIAGVTQLSEIGRGGFGVVYRGWQEGHHRHVAVKRYHDTIADDVRRAQLRRELMATGILSSHPHVLDVYTAGFDDDDHPYLVMEHAAPGSFGDVLRRRGPLPWEDALRHAVELSGALETAHRAGILHRDLKPENIFRSSYGHALLGDFGVARLQGFPEAIHEELPVGTLAHAAPELIEGASPAVAADLYALGTTLFTLLAGRSPFLHEDDRSMAAVLARIRTAPVPDLRPAGVPDAVCDLVERLMAKAPDHRFASAHEVGLSAQELMRNHALHPPLLALSVES
jgi:serine/threonine-protein kinase PknK